MTESQKATIDESIISVKRRDGKVLSIGDTVFLKDTPEEHPCSIIVGFGSNENGTCAVFENEDWGERNINENFELIKP
jgi:hypothetical protein